MVRLEVQTSVFIFSILIFKNSYNYAIVKTSIVFQLQNIFFYSDLQMKIKLIY